MRVVFDVVRDGLPALEAASSRLAAARQQVASGRRVTVASDDPAAVQQTIGERAAIGAVDAYRSTSDSASVRLAATDTVLSSMVENLTIGIVTALGARGTSVTPSVRTAAAAQVRSLRDALVSNINTTFNGASLFAGTGVDMAAYAQVAGAWTYQGDSGAVKVEVERGRLIETTQDGRAIAQGTDVKDMFTVLDELATAIEAGNGAAIDAGLAGLDRAFDRVLAAQGRLGADERAVDDAAARLSALRLAAEIRRARLEDANLAVALTELSEADTAYRAALGAISGNGRISLLDYLK